VGHETVHAAPAGIVNRAGRQNDQAFREVVSGAPEEIQELARAVRALVFDVLPETVEVVWPKQGSVGWGTGPKKFREQFAYLMPFTRHVTLGPPGPTAGWLKAYRVAAAWRMVSTSSSRRMSLETRMPPASRAMFQVRPQSSRLIVAEAEYTARSLPHGSRAWPR
jgi:hypothetical protein